MPTYKEYKKDGVSWHEKKIYCYPQGKYPETKGPKKLAYVQQYRENTLMESIVYYEIWPNWESKFVSKNGYYKYKNGKSLLLIDSIAVPDNIILETYDSNQNRVTYVYKNGKKELHTLGLPNGVKQHIYTVENPCIYIWKDGKKILIEKFDKDETP